MLVALMDKKLYPEFKNNWDDVRFRELLLSKMNEGFACLDYGAGRGNIKEMNFKGIVKFVAGIDPDEIVKENPYVDESKVLPSPDNTIPYDENTFDLIFSDNVMEHVEFPEIVFKEIRRVLKPGGKFIFKTPNKWHYMPIVATFTPTWFHKFYNKLRGRNVIDTFPTQYNCNSISQVKKSADASGLKIKSMEFWEGRPEYLRITAITYVFGYLYERLVNSTDKLKSLRCVLVCELEK